MFLFKSFLLLVLVSCLGFAQVALNEVMPSNDTTFADEDGEYPDWIELYNNSSNPVNLQGYGLSDNSSNPLKWVFSAYTLQPHELLVVFASGKNRIYGTFLHTNFKLKSSGDSLFLSDPQGNIVSSLGYQELGVDVSYGRQPDASNNFTMFDEPTPWWSNNAASILNYTDEPEFSQEHGFFSSPITLTLIGEPQSEIRYTLDGNEPNESSLLYSQPIQLDSSTVVRAKAFKAGMEPSKTITQSYIFTQNQSLPIISLSSSPDNFWSNDSGIYVMGDSASPVSPHYGANFWQDWERPIHIEFFESNGTNAFTMDAGTKIYGGWSRKYPQKSLALYARSEYGYGKFDYQFFPDVNEKKFESIVLRNSGQDWNKSFIRDAVVHSIGSEMGVDVLGYRPASVYLNGSYMGIHGMREKLTKHYLKTHYKNIDENNIDLIETDGGEIEGDNHHYFTFLYFLEHNDISQTTNYDYVKSVMDVDNFINYMTLEIFVDNTDWPGSNIKYWRERNENGKWRWILYDADFAFGRHDTAAYSHNTLAFATAENGPEWPNPEWSTFLIRKMLTNSEFKVDFINRAADLMNTTFQSENVKSKIDSLKGMIADEMPKHLQRWELDINVWHQHLNRMKVFADKRVSHLRQFYAEYFNLGGTSTVAVNSDTSKGNVKVNSIKIKNQSWSGVYFNNVPVKIKAQPKDGFHFVRWEGASNSKNPVITITINGDISLTAVYEADSLINNDVVINEINYNSSENSNSGDWIELYNKSSNSIDLSGWAFKDNDDDNEFIIPSGTSIDAGGYLVLVNDSSLFQTVYPSVTNYIGSFDFNLSNGGETVRLFSADTVMADVLTYNDKYPWPAGPDGNGKSLSLNDALLNNTDPANWSESNGTGTPGMSNGVVSSNDDNGLKIYSYNLDQNYPNPFNPSTTIRYSVAENSHVKLAVYDILGKEVDILVNEERPAGEYKVLFNASSLASGVYFYTITSGNFIQTKKLILMK